MTHELDKNTPIKILLLVFVHGFLGSDDSFCDFPTKVKKHCISSLGNTEVHSIVYPTYETRRDLSSAVAALSKWLTSNISTKFLLDSDKAEKKQIDVILLGHSMGGLLVTDVTSELCPSLQFINTLNEIQVEKQSIKKHTDECEELYVPTEFNNVSKLLNKCGSTIKILGLISYDTPFYGINHEALSDTALSKFNQICANLNQTKELGLSFLDTFGATSNAKSINNAAAVTSTAGVLTGFAAALNSLWGNSKSFTSASTSNIKSTNSIPSLGKSTSSKNTSLIQTSLLAATAVVGVATTIYLNKKVIDAGVSYISEHLLFVSSLYDTEGINQRMINATTSKVFKFHAFYNVINTKASGFFLSSKKQFVSIPSDISLSKNNFTQVPSELDNEIFAHMNMFDSNIASNVDNLVQETVLKIKEFMYL
ncbi:hypothetical protein BB561_000678 [Smittium simulii]|uniref:DUF676 domain-containing protein n=1 Tax=Smittium simulii TaxID=133385 RepID=A0A2T9YY86_9FUNG|nr:hypothetical protein BB561_000678 [Smittium simulii]